MICVKIREYLDISIFVIHAYSFYETGDQQYFTASEVRWTHGIAAYYAATYCSYHVGPAFRHTTTSV